MLLRRSFDHLARPYAWLEQFAFADALEQTRRAHLAYLAYLDRTQSSARVLVLGEGDGRFLERALAATGGAEFDVVDKSRVMLSLAAERTAGSARVRFHEMDVRDYSSSAPYGVVVTNFFLDCFEGDSLARIVPAIASMLAPGGLWLYGDFSPDARDATSRALVWSLYRAFRLVTDIESRVLVDPRAYLAEAGLVRLDQKYLGNSRLVSEVWSKG